MNGSCSREESYGSEAMGSTNHVQHIPKSPPETSSPSSAFEISPAIDMEITLVNSQDSSDNDNGRLPDVVVEAKVCDEDEQIQETYFSIAIQVFIPFLIAGFGMVFAGLVLDKIQVNNASKFYSSIGSFIVRRKLTLLYAPMLYQNIHG